MTVSRMHLFGHDSNKSYKCTVRYLDDSSWDTTYFKSEDSQKFFDRICGHINLIEKDYFGLRFVDDKKQRRWLDLGKNARKQLKKAGKDSDNVIVCFRVKFYPPDPIRIVNEELTRYQLFLQLRRDLQHGRLYGSSGDEAVLLACILQSELADMPPGTDKVPEEYRTLIKHGKKGETKALEQWNALRGTASSDCEARFITKASELDTFGIDPHPVRNEEDQQVFLGYNHFGIIAFQGSKKIMHLEWAHILKMSYEGRMFLVHYVRDSKKNTRGFKCPTAKAAKHLWRNSLETKIFFTAPTSKNLSSVSNKPTIFSRASRIRFSGRVAREAFEKSQTLQRSGVTFPRVAFGQKPEADLYEAVIATPALRRRPSIYPVQPDGTSTTGIKSTTVENHSTTPLPPEGGGGDGPSGPPSPNPILQSPSSQPEFIPGAHSTLVEPPTPVKSVVSDPFIVPEELHNLTPTTDNILSRMRNRVDDVLSESRNNGYVRAPSEDEIIQTDSSANMVPATATRSKALLGVFGAALLVVMIALGMYTLGGTNWISKADGTNMFEPLRTSIYVPIKGVLDRSIFAWWH